MIVMNELDSNGRPMLLKVRVLKSTESDGLVLEEGRVMKILLGTALKLNQAWLLRTEESEKIRKSAQKSNYSKKSKPSKTSKPCNHY